MTLRKVPGYKSSLEIYFYLKKCISAHIKSMSFSFSTFPLRKKIRIKNFGNRGWLHGCFTLTIP